LNILVVKLSSMGDIVLATPSIRALRSRWPDARISVAINEEFAPLLQADPAVDDLVIRDKTLRTRRLITLRQALRHRLARWGPPFDLAIDLQGNFHSAAWTYLSGARDKAGFGGGRPGWRFSVPLVQERHVVDEIAAVVERLGAPVADRQPVIHAAPSDRQFIGNWLARHGLPERGFLIVHPFAAWRSKEWPVERFAAVLKQIVTRRPGLNVLVTGAAAEAERADRLVALAGQERIASAAGKLTLGQSLALWSRARLCFAGDTGALHASAALGVPVLALFGPTLPEISGPLGAAHRVLQASRPLRQAAYREPGAERHMLAITEPMATETLEQMLR
jgi:heptosyltransferase-1/heptosyltransferase-2